MSTYYETYMFAMNKDGKLRYIGLYDKQGKPHPVFGASGSFIGETLGDAMYQDVKSLKLENNEDPLKFFGIQSDDSNYYPPQCTVLTWSELTYNLSPEIKTGFIYRTLKRQIELNGLDKDEYLSNYWDDEDDPEYAGIITIDEYQKLSPDDQRRYFFEIWHNTSDESLGKNSLISACKSLYNAVEYTYHLDNGYDEIVLVSLIE